MGLIEDLHHMNSDDTLLRKMADAMNKETDGNPATPEVSVSTVGAQRPDHSPNPELVSSGEAIDPMKKNDSGAGLIDANDTGHGDTLPRLNYQQRVRAWVLECFGPVIADDMTERSFRFLEEALELVQSIGCSREQAARLVEYVYGREVGRSGQEVGGVMVTLSALTSAAGIDLQDEADAELARVNQPEIIAKIRRKQAMKRGVVSHAAAAALPGEWQVGCGTPPSLGEEKEEMQDHGAGLAAVPMIPDVAERVPASGQRSSTPIVWADPEAAIQLARFKVSTTIAEYISSLNRGEQNDYSPVSNAIARLIHVVQAHAAHELEQWKALAHGHADDAQRLAAELVWLEAEIQRREIDPQTAPDAASELQSLQWWIEDRRKIGSGNQPASAERSDSTRRSEAPRSNLHIGASGDSRQET